MTQNALKSVQHFDAETKAIMQETAARKANTPKDYFTTENGTSYAGKHLLLDFWGAQNLTDPDFIEKSLRQAAEDAGATILFSHMHHFSPFDGVTGVVILSESHITIHTWPERNYAAIDIFMCGECDVRHAVPALREAFCPDSINAHTEKRGQTQIGT